MNTELAALVALLALVGAGFCLWGRGMVRARSDDLVGGFAVFVVACLIYIAAAGSSAVFAQVGGLVMLFGLLTLIMSFFANPECPLTRGQRTRFGIGAIVLGLLMGMII
jgi:hypothetical protein